MGRGGPLENRTDSAPLAMCVVEACLFLGVPEIYESIRYIDRTLHLYIKVPFPLKSRNRQSLKT